MEDSMMRILALGVLLVGLMSGCIAVGTGRAAPPVVSAAAAVERLTLRPGSVVGQPVAAVALAQLGRRLELFDAAGQAAEALRRGQAGSLSVHAKDESGQDNYAFDADGIVTRHRRSYGANFAAGVWEEVAVPAAQP
jgi:hypothetical protein